jgi:serine/threonine protein kinase
VESYGSGEIVWQAPEIITRGARIDLKKANIYAFGVIMCEILSRSSPFQSLIDELGNTQSDIEIVKRVRRKEVLTPHEHHQEYMFAPESLRNTIKLCLSINPEDRPSAEDIILLLQDAKIEEIAASLRTGGDFFV